MRDYEADVHIDPNGLDVAWLAQPQLMLDYSEAAAKAREEMDFAKEKLDVVEAELKRDIRADPEGHGLEKATDKAIESAVLLEEKYQKASKVYIEAKYEAEMARAAVAAIEHKKAALENLVRLYGASYFAGPSAPRDLAREWREWAQEEDQRRVDSKVRVRRTK